MLSPRIELAITTMLEAHGLGRRKSGQSCEATHVLAVGLIVKDFGFGEDAVISGILGLGPGLMTPTEANSFTPLVGPGIPSRISENGFAPEAPVHSHEKSVFPMGPGPMGPCPIGSHRALSHGNKDLVPGLQ